MDRVFLVASRATRTAYSTRLLQGSVVGGCALALILAGLPLGI